jgi:RNA polymerase sigma-70 factor (ECF subfamily)
VITIARNTVAEHYRALGRRAQEKLSPDMFDLNQVSADSTSPEDSAERRDLAEKVAQHIQDLPRKHREVLRLRFFCGLTYEQTAAVTGMSVNYVKVAQHRALAKLRRILPNRDSGMAEYVYAHSLAIRETVPAAAKA